MSYELVILVYKETLLLSFVIAELAVWIFGICCLLWHWFVQMTHFLQVMVSFMIPFCAFVCVRMCVYIYIAFI